MDGPNGRQRRYGTGRTTVTDTVGQYGGIWTRGQTEDVEDGSERHLSCRRIVDWKDTSLTLDTFQKGTREESVGEGTGMGTEEVSIGRESVRAEIFGG